MIYDTWCPDGLPSPFFPDNSTNAASLYSRLTKEFLQRGNLKLIATGHRPQGDLPTPIRVSAGHDQPASWILACDTSYSGYTMWHNEQEKEEMEEKDETVSRRENFGCGTSLSFRGDVAVSEVLMELDNGKLRSVHSHGVLSDGSQYESKNLLELDEPQAASIRIGEIALCRATVRLVYSSKSHKEENVW